MTQRFAIAPSVGAGEILEVARAESWIARAVTDSTANAPAQILWTTGSETVTYVEDDLLDVRYVQVEGSGERVLEALRSRGMIMTVAEVADLAATATTPEELLATTCYVGVAAGETVIPEFLNALKRALVDEHPQVRRVAVMACAYPGWPELLPRLEQMADADSDPEARQLAGRVAASLRTSPDPGGAQ